MSKILKYRDALTNILIISINESHKNDALHKAGDELKSSCHFQPHDKSNKVGESLCSIYFITLLCLLIGYIFTYLVYI